MLTIISIFGIIASTNLRHILLAVLISLELLLLSSVLTLVQNTLILNESIGQLFIAFIITFAGCETCCGLALIVSCYRTLGTISLEPIN